MNPVQSQENDDTPRLSFIKTSALTNLTSVQQEQLYEWLELYPAKQVLEMVAAEPPKGFGIVTHLTSLRRFHARARALFHKQLKQDAASDPLEDPNTPALSGDKLTMNALRHAALELSTVHQTSPTHFNAVSRWLLRLKEVEQRQEELALTNKRLSLERDKFEYNAARATLIHLNQLKDILHNDTTDDEDKVNAAREKIFGPRSNLIEPKP